MAIPDRCKQILNELMQSEKLIKEEDLVKLTNELDGYINENNRQELLAIIKGESVKEENTVTDSQTPPPLPKIPAPPQEPAPPAPIYRTSKTKDYTLEEDYDAEDIAKYKGDLRSCWQPIVNSNMSASEKANQAPLMYNPEQANDENYKKKVMDYTVRVKQDVLTEMLKEYRDKLDSKTTTMLPNITKLTQILLKSKSTPHKEIMEALEKHLSSVYYEIDRDYRETYSVVKARENSTKNTKAFIKTVHKQWVEWVATHGRTEKLSPEEEKLLSDILARQQEVQQQQEEESAAIQNNNNLFNEFLRDLGKSSTWLRSDKQRATEILVTLIDNLENNKSPQQTTVVRSLWQKIIDYLFPASKDMRDKYQNLKLDVEKCNQIANKLKITWGKEKKYTDLKNALKQKPRKLPGVWSRGPRH